MVFAGGGSRFAYFLGLHAAACEAGHRPDLLLATCGGAYAAAVLQRLPDPDQARAWMMGEAARHFICSFRVNPRLRHGRAAAAALRRALTFTAGARCPDLWSNPLFALDAPVPLPPDVDGPSAAARPAVALIGARVLYPPALAGRARAGRPLFEETVFTTPPVAARLAASACAAAEGGSTLAPTLATRTDLPLHDAVHLSMIDLHYLPPRACGPDEFVGGFVDLVPIELARRLAAQISLERKAAFGRWLAAPALREALGRDPACRAREVQRQPADWWIDTVDMRRAAPPLVERRLGRHGLALVPPATLAAHAERVARQWEYGYARGRAAYAGSGIAA